MTSCVRSGWIGDHIELFEILDGRPHWILKSHTTGMERVMEFLLAIEEKLDAWIEEMKIADLEPSHEAMKAIAEYLKFPNRDEHGDY
jgi:hypothetical protein